MFSVDYLKTITILMIEAGIFLKIHVPATEESFEFIENFFMKISAAPTEGKSIAFQGRM